MPTYVYACSKGCTFSVWQSIHDDALTHHAICGGTVKRVISPAPFHKDAGAGKTVDRKERRWDHDMRAYHNLRMDGLQPPGIDGSEMLEARANDEWFVKTGGRFGVPEDRKEEINEMLALGQENPDQWSPIEEVKERRAIQKR